MDLKQIQDLVKMVNKSNISELTIEEMAEGVLGAHRRIGPPAGTGGASRHQEAGHQDHAEQRKQPEGCCIQPGEGHVGRADHRRNQQVVEAVEDRKQKQEQHHCSMHGVEAVVDGRIHQIGWWCDQLTAHDHRQQAADQQKEERRDDVLDADHLGIGVEAEEALPVVRC
ncbi:MAG: hypothetical protein RL675_515, partial [Bacteroidota bacterium]